ncbi:MAG: FtsX-like permease family protein [Thermoguttaceae bacterium]|jgi:cell division protein FtsX
MTIWRLIHREIAYRKTNFLLSMLAVLVAVGSVVAAVSLLDRYAIRGQQRAAEQQAELQKKMAVLEDDYRKIMLGLGFNVLILPKEQNLADFYAEDFASKLMPENYAEKLVQARVASINHVLPILQQKVQWPERERTIQLVGTRGEIALLAKGRKTALLDPVLPGHVVVGYELHRSLKLAVGERIALCKKPLTVSVLQPQRGNQDDITLWINLREAQQILGKEGRINAIQALECNCAADRLGQIREEIGGVLPDTQVIEFSGQALARAEARNRAAAEAREATQRQQQSDAAAARDRERLFAVLVPLVIGACAVWAGLLALGNVRSRTSEIGILRALGVSARRILAIFLVRAALIGLLGASLGFVVGWLGSWLGENRLSGGPPLAALFDPRLFALVLVLTPILSALISWLPAMWAAQLDPADSLRTDSAG